MRSAFLIFLLLPFIIYGQHESDTINQKDEELKSLSDYFSKGKIKGHFRTYFMHTNNNGELSDYHALGTGLGVGYETASFKGVKAVISGFIIHNITSSNLNTPDPLTGIYNRYEIGLFDIEHRDNKHDLDRLEELYITYSNNHHEITFGKQFLETPILNAQDSRMRPNLFEGIVYEYYNPDKSINWEGGYIYRFSPRSTVEWYKTTETIGLYNKNSHEENEGLRPDSKGVIYGKIGIKHNSFRAELWDFYFENLINNSLFISEYDNKQFKLGLQLFHQKSVQSKSFEEFYHEHDHSASYISTMAGYKLTNGIIKIAYSRIGNKGQYLIPREYGKEKMYTTMPRERLEGIADANVYYIASEFKISHKINLRTSAGYFDIPSPSDATKNRYGLPSFYQGVIDFQYHFTGFLEGMETRLLLTRKFDASNNTELAYEINRVNMTNFNIILNYHFNQNKPYQYHGHK
ncbi:hypothetical protein [Marinigracilibium pacificum]|uniref:Outer membrane OprD family porin n=1 Tax=Marinigracilibium pacificum TaxID=2729599 RepID=A0A848J0T2_9BACT|nr:hypothetical protein [Marinigracilibium pacificum]NMM48160.1 hypothetical protein [Marinigracilibium pacificum]